MIVNNQATLALTPTADQSDLEGYFVEVSGANVAVCNAATDIPLGVIIDGEPTTGKSTIAVSGAFGGIVTVKVAATSPGTINRGTYLTLRADGTVQADAGSGARVRVARALESAAAGELVQAVLVEPVALV
jgi:hypothetical protein